MRSRETDKIAHKADSLNSLKGSKNISAACIVGSYSVCAVRSFLSEDEGMVRKMPVLKATIMDEETLHRTVRRMSYEIVEKNKGTDNICLVGIKRRGEILAQMIAENIQKSEDTKVPCGTLDIGFYRDDLCPALDAPIINHSSLPFDVVDKKMIIVDDVLYTGRTVRSAIDAIFSLGRPKAIQLAILIDRGHRELPFRADYIGKSIPTAASERVAVMLPPYDSTFGVNLYGE